MLGVRSESAKALSPVSRVSSQSPFGLRMNFRCHIHMPCDADGMADGHTPRSRHTTHASFRDWRGAAAAGAAPTQTPSGASLK